MGQVFSVRDFLQASSPKCTVVDAKVRKLISKGSLAPFGKSNDTSGAGQEECPICFHDVAAVNFFVCCGNPVCTECFIQLQGHRGTETLTCPYCKSEEARVKFRKRTKEEKERLVKEEQQTIAAQLAARRNEEEEAQRQLRNRRSEPAPTHSVAGTSQPDEARATAAAIARAQLDLAAPAASSTSAQGRSQTRSPPPPASPDWVPTSIWSMGLTEDEMNEIMLEQALAQSVRDATAASHAPTAPSAAASTRARDNPAQRAAPSRTVEPAQRVPTSTPPAAPGSAAAARPPATAAAGGGGGGHVVSRFGDHARLVSDVTSVSHVSLEQIEEEMLRHAIAVSLCDGPLGQSAAGAPS